MPVAIRWHYSASPRPWVLMFAFAPQMHTRYLTWGAAATALCVGISFSLTLLHFLVSIFATITIMSTLLRWNQQVFPKSWNIVHTMYPDIGWSYRVQRLSA